MQVMSYLMSGWGCHGDILPVYPVRVAFGLCVDSTQKWLMSTELENKAR